MGLISSAPVVTIKPVLADCRALLPQLNSEKSGERSIDRWVLADRTAMEGKGVGDREAGEATNLGIQAVQSHHLCQLQLSLVVRELQRPARCPRFDHGRVAAMEHARCDCVRRIQHADNGGLFAHCEPPAPPAGQTRNTEILLLAALGALGFPRHRCGESSPQNCPRRHTSSTCAAFAGGPAMRAPAAAKRHPSEQAAACDGSSCLAVATCRLAAQARTRSPLA